MAFLPASKTAGRPDLILDRAAADRRRALEAARTLEAQIMVARFFALKEPVR